jgi:hypothetical protein
MFAESGPKEASEEHNPALQQIEIWGIYLQKREAK